MIRSTSGSTGWTCTGFDNSTGGCHKHDTTVIQIKTDNTTHYFCPDCLAKAIQQDPNRLFGSPAPTEVVECESCSNPATYCEDHSPAGSCTNCGDSEVSFCSASCAIDYNGMPDDYHSGCSNCGDDAYYCSAGCAIGAGNDPECGWCGGSCSIVCTNEGCDECKTIVDPKQQVLFMGHTTGQPQQVAANSPSVSQDGSAVNVDGTEFRFG